MKWGLTDEQIKARAGGIGGSDARVVCHGTPEERYDLWREKIGEKKPRKIMSDWAAAWRHTTEALQLDWYEHTHPGERVSWRGEPMVHDEHKWMRCTLDGMIDPGAVPINAKHLSSWTKDARAWAVEHYTCQMTHEATVCGADYGLLSLIHGEKEPEIIRIDVDPFYQQDMIEREAAFWKCCVERVPPPDCEELATPKVATPVKRLRVLDATAELGSDDWKRLVAQNNWLPDLANAAFQFAETEGAMKAHQAARGEIGKLLAEDVGELLLTTKQGLFTAKRRADGVPVITLKRDGEK